LVAAAFCFPALDPADSSAPAFGFSAFGLPFSALGFGFSAFGLPFSGLGFGFSRLLAGGSSPAFPPAFAASRF
jgi:hypothetical protein